MRARGSVSVGSWKRRNRSVQGSVGEFDSSAYPEGNLLHANTLHDLPVDESLALSGAVDGADVAKDLSKWTDSQLTRSERAVEEIHTSRVLGWIPSARPAVVGSARSS